MNKRIKLSAAICGLLLASLVGSLRMEASLPTKVKGCFGKDDRVCFIEDNREYYGRWMEVIVRTGVDLSQQP